MKLPALPLLLLVPALAAAADAGRPFHPRIERLDPAFDALVAVAAPVRALPARAERTPSLDRRENSLSVTLCRRRFAAVAI